MQGTWHVKWIWAAVLFTYLVVQVFALRRLKGDQRRRSKTIFRAMIILVFVEDTMQSIFFVGNRGASRVGTLLTGVAAIVATVVLARMFGESPVVAEESQQDEHKLQSLNLG